MRSGSGVEPVVLGPVPEDELPALVAACEVFTFPSTKEGFGLAEMEALAAARPVVASDLPVLQEVFADAVTYAADTKELAGALGAAFTPQPRRAVAGRALAESLTWDAAARAHLAFYRAHPPPYSEARSGCRYRFISVALKGILWPSRAGVSVGSMEWNYRSASEMVTALRGREVSSVELVESAIAGIECGDGPINAICVQDFDRALTAARHADRAYRLGEDRPPLLGVPVTVKESYNVAGMPTTWGMPEHRDWLPADDAVQVSRLKAAGAIVLGKTNVPLGLQDVQTFNDVYGTTNNPWNLGRTSGGSSGGSAAALASGFGALSIGSDLAGSLRTPAHFCGIYAHKPTLGLVAMRGMTPPRTPALPAEPDLAVAGPMARTAGDLALLLDVMAGSDPYTYVVAQEVTLPSASELALGDFRVVVLDEHPLIATSAAVRAGVNRVAAVLTAHGARVEWGTPLLPDMSEAASVYMQLLFSGATARFPVDTDEQLQSRASRLSPDDRSLDAARLRGMVLRYRDWIAVNHRREVHRHGWRQLFVEFDAVVCPVTPTPAFPHDHNPDLLGRRFDIDGVEYPYVDQLVWAGLATMPGLPATAIPSGLSSGGLPVGVQLIGPMFGDRTTIRLAELLEQHIGGFQAPSARRG